MTGTGVEPMPTSRMAEVPATTSQRRVGWLDEAGLPMERRYRRPRQPDPELATEDLGARLEQLRLMVREIEAEILALGSSGEGGNLE